ncbi:sigma-70 family RNA polymerase sigma factor [Methylobacterium sp. C25]|uniref:sigma-70 family RNA polymerase sigma factor n=1 Tax=Methylobacterium sp. C25 TaxID=2721622 RepID=UPI001F162C75|nr:sigma-70 family RNA polymerase sigma factor [Methylobacterium sp. C25]MCE4224058.1 sigma-70 family RNA polymerase sigma factor [Methylobacterium sp. C25]
MSDGVLKLTQGSSPFCKDVRYSAAIQEYLKVPLQDYFELAEREPVPATLAALLARFEKSLATGSDAVTTIFREDLIKALPALRTFAVSLTGNIHRADDLVQETFLKAWANHHRFMPGTNFTAWLFTILRNHFYSDIRKKRREVEDSDGIHAEHLTALADQEDVSTLQAVWKRIEKLPLTQRQALLMVGAEGCTYEEAASKLGCQVGTVKSRVSRARSSLVEALGAVVPGQSHADL